MEYKVIINGETKIVSEEQAEILIENWRKRNNWFSIDEMWKTRDTIYLDDFTDVKR